MPVRERSISTSRRTSTARELVRDLLDHGVKAADPYPPVKAHVRLEGNILRAGDSVVPLSDVRRILVVGAGKASLRIVQALEDCLGDRISAGVVAIKRGQPHDLRFVRVHEASHPLPDESSVLAATHLLRLVTSAAHSDLVLTAITGGSSSLICLPPEGVSLREKRALHRALLLSGATIQEVNSVRKHVSAIKGGRLALAALPARVLNLTVSDVVGDPLDCVAGPVVADSSTLADAVGVLQKYDLWAKLSSTIRSILADSRAETPKHLDPERVKTIYVMPLEAACQGARVRALALNHSVEILSTRIEGESRDVGRWFGETVALRAKHHRLTEPPCVLLACGEMTVTMPEGGGLGGPNQEAALAAATPISGVNGAAIGFLGTDGTDGPTRFAGGLVDGSTLQTARSEGLELNRTIARHDSTAALKRLDSLISTGPTGTNLADLIVGVIA